MNAEKLIPGNRIDGGFNVAAQSVNIINEELLSESVAVKNSSPRTTMLEYFIQADSAMINI